MTYRPFAIKLLHDGNVYEGKVTPYNDLTRKNEYPVEYNVILNGIFRGVFTKKAERWESTSLTDCGLVKAIGNYITDWYS